MNVHGNRTARMNGHGNRTTHSNGHVDGSSHIRNKTKLLFAYTPSNMELQYYRAYTTSLQAPFELIRQPQCSVSDLSKAIVRYKLTSEDAVLFNQMCINHYYLDKSHAGAVHGLSGVNCRIAFLNKEYSDLDKKLIYIKTHINATLVLTHHHTTVELQKELGVTVVRIPFATSQEFSFYAKKTAEKMPYLRDIGHSGNPLYYNNGTLSNTTKGNSWRMMFDNMARNPIVRRADGVMVSLKVAMVPISKSIAGYVRNIAESKMWFSTTSQGSLLPQRTFEVLASGRALLIMNRPDDPRITDGIIVEGEHCAMFNTTEEFIEKVIYYSTHEEERMRIVSNAHRLALAEHQWSNRGNAIRQLIENGTCFSGEVI